MSLEGLFGVPDHNAKYAGYTRQSSQKPEGTNENSTTLPGIPDRKSTGGRRESIHIEDEYLEGGRRVSIERYLLGKRKASVRAQEIHSQLNKGNRPQKLSNPFDLYSSEPLWEKYEERQVIPTRWHGNSIDKGSLYSMKKVNIAGRDLPFLSHPPVRKTDDVQLTNIEQKREREYINRCHLTDGTQNTFNRAVLQHFYRAPVPRSHPGYGMPRPETTEECPFRLLIKDLERDPSILSISHYPSLTVLPSCSKTHGLCEILGPGTCSDCIEGSNRFIGGELQRILFPEIEMTMTKLVKPKLAKVMCEGNLLQMRKRTLPEFHIPELLIPLKRHEDTMMGKKIKGMKKEHTKYCHHSRSSSTIHLTTVHGKKVQTLKVM